MKTYTTAELKDILNKHALWLRGDPSGVRANLYGVDLYDALTKINEVPRQAISSDISEKNGTAWITARSATFMRGINLEKKVVIIDECQNMSIPIIKRIISRCYDNCKVIICGCQAQTDVPIHKSGFKQLMDHMEDFDGYIKCELPISYRGKLAMHIDKL